MDIESLGKDVIAQYGLDPKANPLDVGHDYINLNPDFKAKALSDAGAVGAYNMPSRIASTPSLANHPQEANEMALTQEYGNELIASGKNLIQSAMNFRHAIGFGTGEQDFANQNAMGHYNAMLKSYEYPKTGNAAVDAFGDFSKQLINYAPAMAPMAVAGLFSGGAVPLAGAATFGITAMSDFYKNSIEEGVHPGLARAVALPVGAINAALGAGIFSGTAHELESAAINAVVKDTVPNAIKDYVVHNASFISTMGAMGFTNGLANEVTRALTPELQKHSLSQAAINTVVSGVQSALSAIGPSMVFSLGPTIAQHSNDIAMGKAREAKDEFYKELDKTVDAYHQGPFYNQLKQKLSNQPKPDSMTQDEWDANRENVAMNSSHFYGSVYADVANQTKQQTGADLTPAMWWVANQPQIEAMHSAVDGALGQTAFHGSPYLFDKFSTQKIGAGEGNQAYGWGMYFASQKGIAEYYRDTLSKPQRLRPTDEVVQKYQPEWDALKEEHQKVSDEYKRNIMGDTGDLFQQRVNIENKMDDLHAKMVKESHPDAKGRIYEVDLSPKENEYLDWDKPLDKQSPKVQKILKQIASEIDPDGLLEDGWRKGKELYNIIRFTMPNGGKATSVTAEAVSKYLLSKGIPGIKYLDADSRGSGEKSHNYVLFDDSHVKINRVLEQKDKVLRGQYIPETRTIQYSIENADASTLLHEFSHDWFHVMREHATSGSASDSYVKMYSAVKDWLGVPQGVDTLTTAQQEKFANGAVAFAREGVAPNPALIPAFEYFRKQLMGSNDKKVLGAKLDDGIREAFKQMFSTDAEFIRSNLSDIGGKDIVEKTMTLAQSLGDPTDPMNKGEAAAEMVGTGFSKIADWYFKKPGLTPIQQLVARRQGMIAIGNREAMTAIHKILEFIGTDPARDNALGKYIQTHGDPELLKEGMANAVQPETQKAYQDALSGLSPTEKMAADHIIRIQKELRNEMIKKGLDVGFVEDYLHRIYDEPPGIKKLMSLMTARKISNAKPGLAKSRFYETDWEAEQAGLYPENSAIKRFGAYYMSAIKTLADKEFLNNLWKLKMSDGRPALSPLGAGLPVRDAEGDIMQYRINPTSKHYDDQEFLKDRTGYKLYEHPALKTWKWVSQDEDGKPILLHAIAAVHPDAMHMVKTLFDKSAIRESAIGRFLLGVSASAKQTKLDLSLFHPAQIAIHAAHHWMLDPSKIPWVDDLNHELEANTIAKALIMKGGMTIGGDNIKEMFSDEFGGGKSSLVRYIPGIREASHTLNTFTFEEFIPRVKMGMALAAFERNKKAYPTLNEDQLLALTAAQANASFGGLNWEVMGKGQTAQDALRLALLAPDFLFARLGYVKQALMPYNREQRNSLLMFSLASYITFRMLNKILTGDFHFEPENAFRAIIGNHAVGPRLIEGDIVKLITEPGKFLASRLNLVTTRTLIEFAYSRNYYGNKRDLLQQGEDLLSQWLPIGTVAPLATAAHAVAPGLIGAPQQNLAEGAMGMVGIQQAKYTPLNQANALVNAWRSKQNLPTKPEIIANQTPLGDMKKALEENDLSAAKQSFKEALQKEQRPGDVVRTMVKFRNAPFTGSYALESKFMASLTPQQRDDIMKAKLFRQEVFNRFQSIR